MKLSVFVSLLKLVRLDTSLLTACIVFIPTLLREGDLLIAAQSALPILLTCMCCFVLNDIHDLEKDRTNHPQRPLPTGSVSGRTAMGIYFFLLTLNLSTIFVFIKQDQYYIYLLCLVLFTNYDHVVSDFPQLKNIYVAIASTLPILILRPNVFEFTHIDIIAMAMMFFILGRELLMDVQDLPGDGNTLVRRLGEITSTRLGFSFQATAILILSAIANTILQWIAISFLFGSIIATMSLWQRKYLRSIVIHSMKIQAIAGLVFLF